MSAPTDQLRRRVAVCVVTYNHERFIADCLLSVLAQDVEADVILWVGDDQSSDGTQAAVEALVARFPGRIHYLRHAERLGPVGNHRALIERAEGDFIAHLDGDDVWLPGKLREQLALLDAQPLASAACGNALVFDPSGMPLGFFSNAGMSIIDMDFLMERGNFLNHSSLLYRAAHRDAVLAIPSPFVDYRIHIALCRRGPIAYSPATLVGYRYNTVGSVIRTTNEVVREQYWEAVRDGLTNVSDETRARACADFLRRVAFRAVRLRDAGLWRRWRRTVSESVGPRRYLFWRSFVCNVCREALLQLSTRAFRAATGSTWITLYFR